MTSLGGAIENCNFSISNWKLSSTARHSSTIQRFLFLLFFLIAVPLPAAPPNAEFEQANKLYEQGKFKEAAAAYQTLIDRGAESPTIYYNLGNAWYKAGQNGRAVAAYLHTERLAPRDPNVRFNLNFVRNKVNVAKPTTGPPVCSIIASAERHSKNVRA